jgi:hypothetical protein
MNKTMKEFLDMPKMQAYHFSHYKNEPLTDFDRSSIYLGNMDRIPDKSMLNYWLKTDYENVLIELPFSSGSDYSGSTVEYSNYRTLWDEFGKLHAMYKFYGGYSTFGLALKVSSIRNTDRYKELLEAIQSLFDYPLYSEDDLSEYETEVLDECIQNYVLSDLKQELSDRLNVSEDNLQSDENLTELIYQACYNVIEPIFESPFSCYIDIEKLADYVLKGE